MNNLNLIDDYLANRMTDAEKSSFEEKLQADNELRQEFNFHKDIVDSIKETRKAELKSMLNEIPVSSGTSYKPKVGTKIIAGVITGALVIGGLYYFMKEYDTPVDNEPAVEQTVEKQIHKPAETIASQEDNPVVEDIEEKAPVAEQKKEQLLKEEEKAPQTSKPAEISTPNVLDFDTDETDTDITQPEVSTEAGDFSAEELFHSTIEVVTDNTKKKYDFHYQFKDEKLYLYGSFDEDLYQILEFNTKEGRTIILYYKDAYYLLNEHQKEITPLKIIEDEQLIDKLNRLRK